MKTDDQTKVKGDLNTMMNTVVQYGPKIVQNRQLVKLALAMGENYLIKDGKNRKKTDHTLARELSMIKLPCLSPFCTLSAG